MVIALYENIVLININRTRNLRVLIDCQQSDVDVISPELLVLTNVTHEDEDWYTCIAGNSLGVSYASTYLRVVDSKHLIIYIL